MTSKELRSKFLDYFSKRGHAIVPSSSLVTNDPSVLFTTAGMQQFKPYYLGQTSPYGDKTVSCQKCARTSDIEEVGDASHLTFFEMLGNFSFGGYGENFKEEAVKLAYGFIFNELRLSKDEAFFTVFEGDAAVPADAESEAVWKKLAGGNAAVKRLGRSDNFWGPTGLEGPCGPTTEIHYRNIEIWNVVFNQYYQDKNKQLKPLAKKGVDTGMGLERLLMMVQGKSSVFETDLYTPIMERIPGADLRARRVIADHIKSAVFLTSDGVIPSNLDRGYVLRRILRRAIRYGRSMNLPRDFLMPLAQTVVEMYKDVYVEIAANENDVLTAIHAEQVKFERTLEEGLKKLQEVTAWRRGMERGSDSVAGQKITLQNSLESAEILGKKLFDLYQSYGFPLELSFEEMEKGGGAALPFKNQIAEVFTRELKIHQEISRSGVEKKFGGVGDAASGEAKRLHTATHLLHASLRRVLGGHVRQMGSDITAERLRFDFSHPAKMTGEEIKKIEVLVNWAIKEDLPVLKEQMAYEDAIALGALAFFRDKYPPKVNVYSIGTISKEICAGPHAGRTGELGEFRIVKEESSGAGVRRIKAVLEKKGV